MLLAALHAWGIEDPVPVFVGPAGGADANIFLVNLRWTNWGRGIHVRSRRRVGGRLAQEWLPVSGAGGRFGQDATWEHTRSKPLIASCVETHPFDKLRAGSCKNARVGRPQHL